MGESSLGHAEDTRSRLHSAACRRHFSNRLGGNKGIQITAPSQGDHNINDSEFLTKLEDLCKFIIFQKLLNSVFLYP